mgnify:CR=1 FL=1
MPLRRLSGPVIPLILPTEQGSRLLTNVNIKNAIDKAIATRSRRTGINQDRVLLELANI